AVLRLLTIPQTFPLFETRIVPPAPTAMPFTKAGKCIEQFFSCAAYGNAKLMAADYICATLVSTNGTDWVTYTQNSSRVLSKQRCPAKLPRSPRRPPRQR